MEKGRLVGKKRHLKLSMNGGNMQVKNRIMKTMVYRLSASGLAQIVSWLAFGSVQINLAVLVSDTFQMFWCYTFEGFWNRMERLNDVA